MRIHGVHVQGLRIPPGETRIELDSGYCVLVAGRAAGVWARLLLLPLVPERDLPMLGAWLPPLEPDGPAHLGAGLSFGAEAVTAVVDLRQGEIVLARRDPGPRTTSRLAKGASAVAAELAKRGLPSASAFCALHVAGVPEPVAAALRAVDAAESTSPECDWMAETVPDLPANVVLEEQGGAPILDPDRIKQLRDARDRRAELERARDEALRELEAHSEWREATDEIEACLRRHQERSQIRDTELESLEHTRRVLLEEQARLRAVPRRCRGGIAAALTAAAAAALVAPLVGSILHSVALLGLVLALTCASVARSAQRGSGRVEARLSALRVNERSVRKGFESETRDVTELLARLGVASAEELRARWFRLRELAAASESLGESLEEARRTFSDRARAELEEIERVEAALRARAEPAPQDAAPRGRTVEKRPRALAASLLEGLGGIGGFDPELLIAAAHDASGKSASEIRERMKPSLPLYLRVLSEGRIQGARRDEDAIWMVRGADGSSWLPTTELRATQADAVALAFRLAILEGLAPVMRVPLIVGPELGAPGGVPRQAAGRALRRLGSVLQIVHVTGDEADWICHASSVHRLPDPESNASR